MKVRFLSLARAEMDDAFAWYEDQAVGLGYEFLDALDQAIRLITSFPDSHPQAGKKLRRCLLNRFPYHPNVASSCRCRDRLGYGNIILGKRPRRCIRIFTAPSVDPD